MPNAAVASRLIQVFAAGGLLLLVACGSKATPENFDKVADGMSRYQVHAILGRPDQTASEDIGGLMTLTRESWKSSSATVTVTYNNDAVALKSLEPADAAKP